VSGIDFILTAIVVICLFGGISRYINHKNLINPESTFLVICVAFFITLAAWIFGVVLVAFAYDSLGMSTSDVDPLAIVRACFTIAAITGYISYTQLKGASNIAAIYSKDQIEKTAAAVTTSSGETQPSSRSKPVTASIQQKDLRLADKPTQTSTLAVTTNLEAPTEPLDEELTLMGEDNFDYYEQALDEIENDKKHKGAWAKAYAEAPDEESTKRLYTKYRAAMLQQEAIKAELEEQAKADRINPLIEDCKRKLAFRNFSLHQTEDGWDILGPTNVILNRIELPSIDDVTRWINKYDAESLDDYNEAGRTKLMEAVIIGDVDEVKFLLALGASSKIKDNNFGSSGAIDFAGRKRSESEPHAEIYKILAMHSL